ncbi:MAG: hypothetical protein AAGA80_17910, partial [Cyanobacteria bacterium P01_F01_bin.143]
MSSNLSIERGNEKFSFIYTLTVYYHDNSDRVIKDQVSQNSPKTINQHSDSDSYWEKSSAETQNSQQSSALSITKDKHDDSLSLAISNPTTIINDWYALETDEEELDLFSVDAIAGSDTKQNSSQPKISPDKLLLLASFGYLIFIVCWLFSYTTGKNIIPFFASKTRTISKADVEFLDYMQRSLDIIDRQVIAAEKASPAGEENPTVVYVPVYTQAANNPIPRYAPQPLPQAIPIPPPPEFSSIDPPVKIPSPPKPPEPTNLNVAETPKPKDKKLAAVTTPKVNSTLVGLMELGEASAAFFKIDGITQRIWLGDKIQDTNWILESVTSEKATITNQGKSRILTVGE